MPLSLLPPTPTTTVRTVTQTAQRYCGCWGDPLQWPDRNLWPQTRSSQTNEDLWRTGGRDIFFFFLDELELQSVFHIFVFVMTLQNQTRRKMLWCNHNCNPENWIMEQARLLLSWDPNEDRKWIDDFRLLTVCWWYYRGEAAVWQIHLVNITINIIIIIKNHMT